MAIPRTAELTITPAAGEKPVGNPTPASHAAIKYNTFQPHGHCKF